MWYDRRLTQGCEESVIWSWFISFSWAMKSGQAYLDPLNRWVDNFLLKSYRFDFFGKVIQVAIAIFSKPFSNPNVIDRWSQARMETNVLIEGFLFAATIRIVTSSSLFVIAFLKQAANHFEEAKALVCCKSPNGRRRPVLIVQITERKWVEKSSSSMLKQSISAPICCSGNNKTQQVASGTSQQCCRRYFCLSFQK